MRKLIAMFMVTVMLLSTSVYALDETSSTETSAVAEETSEDTTQETTKETTSAETETTTRTETETTTQKETTSSTQSTTTVETETTTAHEHTWTLIDEATYSNKTYYTYTCSCGKRKQESEIASVSTAGVSYYTSVSKAAAYLAACTEELPTSYVYVYMLSDSKVNSFTVAKEILDTAIGLMDDSVGKSLGTMTYGYGQTEYAEGWLVRYKYKFSYTYDTNNTDYVSSRVSSIISSLGISGKSDYAKARAIYSWVCSHVSYDYGATTSERYTAYGALKNGKAVCSGYALLYQKLATAAGLSCRYISGTSYGSGHAWNIVRINGTWYNLDATWDAGNSSYAYFLRGTTFFYKTHTPSTTYGITISASDYSGASASSTGNSVQQSMASGAISEDADALDAEIDDAEEEEDITDTLSLKADPRKVISLPTVEELTGTTGAYEYFNTACAYRNMHEIYSRTIKNNSDFAGSNDKDQPSIILSSNTE